MSLPLHSRLLRSAEQAALPAAFAGLLLVTAVAQLFLRTTPPLPPVETPPIAMRTLAAPGQSIAPVPAYPLIMANAIFAPRAGGAGKGQSAGAELSLAGTALSRGGAIAIVRTASGSQVLRVGQVIDGYRLLAVARDGAAFAGHDGRHAVRVGGALGGGSARTTESASGEGGQ